MQNVTPVAIAALLLELVPAAVFGFAAEHAARPILRWPVAVRLAVPAVFVIPYAIVSLAHGIFQWQWFSLYLMMPVATAWLLMHAAAADSEQRGNWRDAFILLVLGLAVDLRWFDSAWPPGLRALNELFLVDVGLYGFLAIRQLSGSGFDFHLRWSDWKTGLRELFFFTPIVLGLGLGLGFIHPPPPKPARNFQRAAALGGDIFLYCRAGRALFPRVGTKSFRAPRRTPCGSGNSFGSVRPFALQQTLRTLQLALRTSGDHRWNFLWSRVASTPARSGFGDHACQRRLDLGAVVLGAGTRVGVMAIQRQTKDK